MTSNLEVQLREAVAALPKGLREHIRRVEEEAVRLAALGHDLVRHKDDTALRGWPRSTT